MEKIEPIWTVVGNIVEKRINGQDGKEYFGTKYFTPNTKVYIIYPYSSGFSVEVIGRERKTKHFIKVILNIKYIYNFRAKLCYNPNVINKVNHQFFDKESSESFVEEFLLWQKNY